MKNIIIAITSLLVIGCNSSGETTFHKKTQFGKSIESAQEIFKIKPRKVSCSKDVKKCSSKFKKECECYEFQFARMQHFNKKLYTHTTDGIIQKYNLRMTSTNHLALPQLKGLTGDNSPDFVFEGSSNQNSKLFTLLWNFKEGTAVGQVICPVEIYGGELVVKEQLRNCRMRSMNISSFNQDAKEELLKVKSFKLLKKFNY